MVGHTAIRPSSAQPFILWMKSDAVVIAPKGFIGRLLQQQRLATRADHSCSNHMIAAKTQHGAAGCFVTHGLSPERPVWGLPGKQHAPEFRQPRCVSYCRRRSFGNALARSWSCRRSTTTGVPQPHSAWCLMPNRARLISGAAQFGHSTESASRGMTTTGHMAGRDGVLGHSRHANRAPVPTPGCYVVVAWGTRN